MRLSLTLGGLAALNVLCSFAYQWYIYTRIGPGAETDALFASMMLPQLVLAVVAGSLTHVLVPLLSTRSGDDFRRDAWMFFQAIGLVFGSAAFLLFVAAPFWIPATVPGFDLATRELTVELFRIQVLGMVFTALTGVLWSTYHARHRFVWAEASPLVAIALSFPLLVWGLPILGVAAAAWAMVAKSAVQMIFLLPGLGRFVVPDWHSATAREAWHRVRPLLLGTTYYKTDHFLDRFLASMTPAGGVSLLHLATQLYGAGHQVLNTAVAAPLVPRLARLSRQRDFDGVRHLSMNRLALILVITAAGLVGLTLFGRQILSLLFERGRFDAPQIVMLWWLLLALAGTWLGGAAGQILASSFYAMGNTVTPTRIGVVGFTIGIALKLIGFSIFGLYGVAIGATLYYLLNAVLLLVFLNREVSRQARQPSGEVNVTVNIP